jgi:hypothetical protein
VGAVKTDHRSIAKFYFRLINFATEPSAVAFRNFQ